MNRARSECLLLLLFVIIPTLSHSDSVSTFDSARYYMYRHPGLTPTDLSVATRDSVPLIRNSTSLLENTNSGFYVGSQNRDEMFPQHRINLSLAYIGNSANYKDAKNGAKYKHKKIKSSNDQKGNNDDQGEDEDGDGGGQHAVGMPEPPLAATLAAGLALLLFKLRRNR